MSDPQDHSSHAPDLGVYGRATERGLDAGDRIAIGLTLFWVLFCAVFWLIMPASNSLSGSQVVMATASVLMPIALIWIAALAAKSARLMHTEAEQLRAAMDTMRQMYHTQAQLQATTMGPTVERKLDQLVKGQKQTETTLAEFASRRPASRPRPEPAPAPRPDMPQEQPGLALEPEGTRFEPVGNTDFIIALNFPETADDKEGFAALRRALADPRAARLVQASQDVLTLLSQDGIYMDDMSPDRSRPEIWRRFADGERGRTIAGLGGIRDRASLALAAQRMRQDQVFRDTSHHFLRTFDKTFTNFAENASDSEIIKITDTRTARAFMLLGRVAGLFD